MNIKIVSDSSSNLLDFEGVPYATVPLKIITADAEYVDDKSLDVAGMVADLRTVKGRTRTSCPNVYEWQSAMGDAEQVVAVTITGNLSGSYSTAMQARNDLLAEHPDRKIAVIDSLSTGPEMQLLIERLRDEILAGKSFEEVERAVRQYQKHTHLLFSLKSMLNLARNGRVNAVVAKLAGVLGIRVVGVASEQGTLELLHKPRGQEKMLLSLLEEMEGRGYAGGKVRIAHCGDVAVATLLAERIHAAFPDADVQTIAATALCSYYAEEGGLLVGFEDGL